MPTTPHPDRLTLIAISALAYLVAVGLHEHLGHTAACIMLGSHPIEVGAFYVDCDYTGMSDTSIRLVALAGPVVSLVTGIVSFLVLSRVPLRMSAAAYFVWLLGSIGFMSATGYLLFSGISGIGDFGIGRDGLFVLGPPAQGRIQVSPDDPFGALEAIERREAQDPGLLAQLLGIRARDRCAGARLRTDRQALTEAS